MHESEYLYNTGDVFNKFRKYNRRKIEDIYSKSAKCISCILNIFILIHTISTLVCMHTYAY